MAASAIRFLRLVQLQPFGEGCFFLFIGKLKCFFRALDGIVELSRFGMCSGQGVEVTGILIAGQFAGL